MEGRKSLGKPSKKVIIPVPPLKSEMDARYFELRDSIITRIKDTRLRYIMQANTGMIELYWNIGKDILQRQESEGWGAKVIDRLSADLKEEFPEMNGFSPRNLKYMRKFAETWTESTIVQQPVAQLQWRNNDTKPNLPTIKEILMKFNVKIQPFQIFKTHSPSTIRKAL